MEPKKRKLDSIREGAKEFAKHLGVDSNAQSDFIDFSDKCCTYGEKLRDTIAKLLAKEVELHKKGDGGPLHRALCAMEAAIAGIMVDTCVSSNDAHGLEQTIALLMFELEKLKPPQTPGAKGKMPPLSGMN